MSIHGRNKKALTRFILLLSGFLILVDVVLVWMLHDEFRMDFNEGSNAELAFFSELTEDALLHGEYAIVEDAVIEWGAKHADIISFTATMPNGFQLGRYSRAVEGFSVPVELSHVVYMGKQELLRLDVVKDGSIVSRRLLVHGIILVTVSVGLVCVLGALLWRSLRITAVEPLEREVEHRKSVQHELEIANSELESFSYSVSHDLRSPLQVISGFSDIVLMDYRERLDEDGVRHLERIRAGCTRMSELIDHMLQLSRAARVKIVEETVNLSEIASDIIAGLRVKDPDRHVDIDIQADMFAAGDKNLMRIALTNLLGNAWKYSSKSCPASIRFTCVDDGDGNVYQVDDNGAGFDMTYAADLFAVFKRLHSAHEYEGSGVGLATVHRIIERHGGEVWAEAEVGVGAHFYFTLGAVGETREA